MKIPCLLFAILGWVGSTAPALAGSEAYELFIWNQHNGTAKDRGTALYQIEALNATSTVWKSEELKLEWSSTSDPQARIEIPAQRFGIDEIRLHILKWIGNGGGLSELELRQGRINLPAKCKVAVSEVYGKDKRFSADSLVDGVKSSETMYVGYWLLPDGKRGDVFITLPKR